MHTSEYSTIYIFTAYSSARTRMILAMGGCGAILVELVIGRGRMRNRGSGIHKVAGRNNEEGEWYIRDELRKEKQKESRKEKRKDKIVEQGSPEDARWLLRDEMKAKTSVMMARLLSASRSLSRALAALLPSFWFPSSWAINETLTRSPHSGNDELRHRSSYTVGY